MEECQAKSSSIVMNSIYENIKKAYEAAKKREGLSKVMFAKRAGISKSYATDLANGRITGGHIPERTLEKIAAALGTTVRWLETGEGEMVAEERAPYGEVVQFRRDEDRDPVLSDLMRRLKDIRRRGSPVQFGQVRGIIETIHDELKKQQQSRDAQEDGGARTAGDIE